MICLKTERGIVWLKETEAMKEGQRERKRETQGGERKRERESAGERERERQGDK